MKTFKTTLFAALAVLFVVSCSSDDDAGTPAAPAANTFGTGTGQVSVDGIQYTFDKGLITNFGDDRTDGTFNFEIDLFSGNLTIDPLTGPSGIGNYLTLELNSDQASGPKNGTYTFNEDDSVDLTVSSGLLDTEYNFTSGVSDDSFEAESGTVRINKSGNNYTVTINLVLSNGDSMIGVYTGTLGPVDARN